MQVGDTSFKASSNPISCTKRSKKTPMPTNIEIKAICKNPDHIKSILENHQADFKGVDHQIDNYFNVPAGRLKLREGNIENSLIFYKRPNQAGPKKSEVELYVLPAGTNLKQVLNAAIGTKVVVDKQRAIYFIDNVKFHIDTVQNLGSFIEIEAIDTDGSISEAELLEQCEHYLKLFNISEADLLEESYSDMLLRK